MTMADGAFFVCLHILGKKQEVVSYNEGYGRAW